MKNPFPFSDNNKRYHTFTYYLNNRYGCKVAKISLNGGFTCPNIDGTISTGGCTYCSGLGSGEFSGNKALTISEQFQNGTRKMSSKWPDAKYIPYFQPFTNTYAPTNVLRKKYYEALVLYNVVGLYIATRPDCISNDTADLLAEISTKTDLVVELGLQSVFDETGKKINRGHTFADFLQGYEKLHKRGINVGVHIINGLPGETPKMMLETAKTISKLSLHSVKIHLLHVLKNTQLAKQFENGEFQLMTRDEYVSIVCDQLEVLPPQIVIQRVTGDGKANDLIGPMWSIKKLVVMNEIDKELLKRDSFQGKFCN